MKLLLVVATLVALAASKPQEAQVVSYTNDVGVQGYNWAYKLSDNQEHQEQAELKNVGTDNEAISVRGSFSWVAADGKTYKIDYIADENGFQPQGVHLPGGRRR